MGVESTKERIGDYKDPHGPLKRHIGYDGGDAVSSEYKPKFEFTVS